MSESNKCCECNQGELPCTCPCHSTTTSSEDEVVQGIVAHILSTQNWEADTTFLYDAIHSLLSRQREEMVALEEKRRTIEGLKKEGEDMPGVDSSFKNMRAHGYNQAVADILSLLSAPISNKKQQYELD